jgi:hypothetical protein
MVPLCWSRAIRFWSARPPVWQGRRRRLSWVPKQGLEPRGSPGVAKGRFQVANLRLCRMTRHAFAPGWYQRWWQAETAPSRPSRLSSVGLNVPVIEVAGPCSLRYSPAPAKILESITYELGLQILAHRIVERCKNYARRGWLRNWATLRLEPARLLYVTSWLPSCAKT